MEAFEDGEEELVAPDQLEEARLLVREAQNLNDRLSLVPPASLATIARRLESRSAASSCRPRSTRWPPT